MWRNKHIKTLIEQSEKNPNIQKLFGAPHFYLWDSSMNAIKIIDEMYSEGITKAWVGFSNWKETPASRKLVEFMNEKGYLVATYDDYHCIHKYGNEEWSTATFQDTTLYTTSTIQNRDGSYPSAFLGIGRYLNPKYSMDELKYRTHNILKNGAPLNSWFIDCDATGEVHDDYTLGHESNKQQNIEARINRMLFLRDSLNMVVGSENGNDFSCSVISFAHGLELPIFTWMDPDMNINQDSEYFVGLYYHPIEGEVPFRFSKQVPIKPMLYNLFLNPVYSVPLYKLVYNDVIVTTNHWTLSSLKFNELVSERMLYEISYNATPLYHLSLNEWDKHKQTIVEHLKVWSKLNSIAIQYPMTDFQFITSDHKVQKTTFGDRITIITNYKTKDYTFGNHNIPPMSALIINNEESFIYTPVSKF